MFLYYNLLFHYYYINVIVTPNADYQCYLSYKLCDQKCIKEKYNFLFFQNFAFT